MLIYSKQDAGMQTAKLRDEKEVLDRQQHADSEKLKNYEENLQQLKSREHELNLQEEQMRTRLKKILVTSTKNKDDLTDLTNELRVMQDKHRDARLFQILFPFMIILWLWWFLEACSFPVDLDFIFCLDLFLF